MTRKTQITVALLAVLVVVEAALLSLLVFRERWRREAEETPVVRGRRLAERVGCFGCHGPGGEAPIPNPGSKSGDVPGWTGGTWMMWNRDASDVRAWIHDGYPPGRKPDPGALIAMPAFGGRLTSREIDDLTAYVLAVSLFGQPDDPLVAEGRDVAFRFGCFGCHGPEGRGVILNPGSFKGYVPAWDGADFAELVRDDAEFDQWVRHGVADRLKHNPAARAFLDRQVIRMPAYGERIGDRELAALRALVRWIRANPRSVEAR